MNKEIRKIRKICEKIFKGLNYEKMEILEENEELKKSKHCDAIVYTKDIAYLIEITSRVNPKEDLEKLENTKKFLNLNKKVIYVIHKKKISAIDAKILKKKAFLIKCTETLKDIIKGKI